METKIENFTDLIAWQEAHRLLLNIYKITASFPKEETYSLVSQMRRCALSITSNIAEGFARSGSKDKIRFYIMAAGSVCEIQNQLIASKDLHYTTEELFHQLYTKTVLINKLINGLIRTSPDKFVY